MAISIIIDKSKVPEYFPLSYYLSGTYLPVKVCVCVWVYYIYCTPPCYYMHISMFIYLWWDFFSATKTRKAIPHATTASFVDGFFLFVWKMWVGGLEKKVKYYFPPPLFELSELNRISFQLFCFCLFVFYFFYFILAWEPRYSSVWLRFCQINNKIKIKNKIKGSISLACF